MALGVLSDIHGNRVALEAVVADGTARGVDRWWAIGDLVAIGPDPVGSLDLLLDLPHVVLTRGNTDRYLVTGDRPFPQAADVEADPSLQARFATVESSFSWTRTALSTDGRLDRLAALPLETRLELDDGTRLLGVHASPGRDDGAGVTPHRPDSELHAETVDADAQIIITGHTHQPTDRVVGTTRLLNGGSVSNPITDDHRASYVIIHSDRDHHRVEHRRVAYDVDRFLAIVRACGHPDPDYLASFQRGEQFRYPAERPGAPQIDH